MAWNQKPGTGYNSDPLIVKAIIDKCYKAGAREVALFDNTFDDWALSYKNSGIERVAKDAAARVIPANDIRYYKASNIENKSGNNLHIHEALIKADVIINLPVVNQKKMFQFLVQFQTIWVVSGTVRRALPKIANACLISYTIKNHI
jgi:uncharacterized protein (DUF362 family)